MDGTQARRKFTVGAVSEVLTEIRDVVDCRRDARRSIDQMIEMESKGEKSQTKLQDPEASPFQNLYTPPRAVKNGRQNSQKFSYSNKNTISIEIRARSWPVRMRVWVDQIALLA